MKTCFGVRGRVIELSVLAVVGMNALGCTSPLVRNLDAYRQAKKRGDYETAARHLGDDARIWFDKKEGEGHPLTAKGGPYKDWDREFRSSSTRQEVRVVGQTVTYISYEINDFYRLIERVPTKARVTYYFDDDDRITGMLYRGLSPKSERPPDRYEEFKQWAAARYPGLLDSPEMDIPNNPKRWRELLVEWRADAGLKPLEGGGAPLARREMSDRHLYLPGRERAKARTRILGDPRALVVMLMAYRTADRVRGVDLTLGRRRPPAYLRARVAAGAGRWLRGRCPR